MGRRLGPVCGLALGAACGVALGAACGPAADETAAVATVDTLPGGHLRVRNRPPPDRFAAERVHLVEEELRIGAVEREGALVFADIRGLLVDPEANLYVLEAQAKEIRVFDAEGRHVRSFGRAGEGPGEFVGPNGMDWGPEGRIWVSDPNAGRYTSYTPDGEFAGSLRLHFPIHGYLWEGRFGDDGRLYDRSLIVRPGEEPREYVLRRIDPASGAVDTLPVPTPPSDFEPAVFEVRRETGGVVMQVPFTPRFVWRLDGRGHAWWALTSDYRIVKHGLPGDTLLFLLSRVDPVRVTAEEREEAIENAREVFEGVGSADLDWSRIPETKPPLENLGFDDRGNLWVQLTPEAGSDGSRYDVYGKDGRWIASGPHPVPDLAVSCAGRAGRPHLRRDAGRAGRVLRGARQPGPRGRTAGIGASVSRCGAVRP